jgi:hypothetical protein
MLMVVVGFMMIILIFKKISQLIIKTKKKWRKELIIDEVRGEVYAKFEKEGLCYLKKIDLITGEIVKTYKLEEHKYPTNIKIKNSEAYYFYKDHFNNGVMSLFKQILSE